jgi:hypothetical protein
MMKHAFLLWMLLLLGILAADQFTFQGQGVVANMNTTQTETWQIGYGAQQIAEDDSMIMGTLIGLAACACIFAYLHIKSESLLWSQLWFLFALLLIAADAMALQTFATEQGSTALAGIGLALFMAFTFVFIIMVLRLIWMLYKQYIDEFMAVLNGRKTNKGQ